MLIKIDNRTAEASLNSFVLSMNANSPWQLGAPPPDFLSLALDGIAAPSTLHPLTGYDETGSTGRRRSRL